jgi:hypothetical protein
MYMERGQRYIVEHQKHTVSIYIGRDTSLRVSLRQQTTHTHIALHMHRFT